MLMPMYLANSKVNTTLVALEYQILEASVTSVQLVVRLDGVSFLSVGTTVASQASAGGRGAMRSRSGR